MMESGGQGTRGMMRGAGKPDQMPGQSNFSNNEDLQRLKNEKEQQLDLAREQMREGIKAAGEKLKASL